MTTELRPESLEFDKLACITIQGGGVYGLTLLGQLQAVRERGFLPVSLAGTSAGAIVATLYWARLTPEGVLTALLEQAQQGLGLLDLIGPFEEGPDEQLIDLKRVLGTVSDLRAAGVQVSDALAGRKVFRQGAWVWRKLFFWAPYLSAYLNLKDRLPPALDRAQWAWARRGVFTGVALQDFLDNLLRRSPLLEHNSELLPPWRGEVRGGANRAGGSRSEISGRFKRAGSRRVERARIFPRCFSRQRR